MASTLPCDVAIVGGGLAGALIALALKARHPALVVRLIEGDDRIGGNHVWSFFGSDIDARDRPLLAPIVAHAWRGYEVAFPHHARRVDATYYSVFSAGLDQAVRAALPAHALMLGRKVLGASATAVVLADGDRVEATGVIDARGPADLSLLDCGWQKFVGRELVLAEPHGHERPTVMDARVAQIDGYRFVYLLPFGPDRMFVEDTYYSDTTAIDHAALDGRIEAYAAAAGWTVTARGHAESGVLPVAMGGDFEAYWRSGGARVAKAGMRAGLFHPTTGYSLPDAVRTARLIATRRDFAGLDLHDAMHRFARQTWQRRGFYRMLDTMLFKAAEPAERYRVLERFYRLSPGLIGRFYAGRSTLMDKARILTGKPPVPIARAIKAIRA
ncbi:MULTISPECIES: lycopene beta-cyclase CrtY [unclassified Sphingomonas]|uniref:lycopene beta-cyclase CrtY n=1 Tax=unclassified Sphingomonas TaxID=196159 RepID=UPI002269DAEF|nr:MULTISPECIES: lycopene beta-cyclase CrtY [unclassified Sphingomonas]